ncbi:MAG: hypothetical protein ACW99A_20885 [Candidatus Kariarchaeaceae archaeon]
MAVKVVLSNSDILKTAIIPVRGINEAMSRLRNDLDNEMVDKIVSKLLVNTIKLVQQLDLQPIVLTSDPILSDMIDVDVQIILDDGTSLNAAVSNALGKLRDEQILFIMPDLPGLTSKILSKFLALQSIHNNVIAPTHDRGTAMACLPKEILTKNFFGKESADRFINECNKLQIPISIYETEPISQDLDTIEDWELWEDYFSKYYLGNSK